MTDNDVLDPASGVEDVFLCEMLKQTLGIVLSRSFTSAYQVPYASVFELPCGLAKSSV